MIGTEDDRGQLFQAYCRIVGDLRPEVFVFENVYGLPGANGGRPWRLITQAFADLGYHLKAEVIDAADYGVPQHRERLILVGTRSGSFSFPLPTHGPDSPSGQPMMSVEAAIEDLQRANEPFHSGVGGMYGHLLPLVPEGLNYAFFTAEMGHPEPVFAWRSKFHDLLYKVDRSEPCRTIKAHPGKFTGPFHWKNRHFTTAELKRLQTFPDRYALVGSDAKVLEQIGNAVPPRLAYAIALSIREQLLEPVPMPELPVRPIGFRSTFRQRQRARSRTFEGLARAAIKKQYGSPSAAVTIAIVPKNSVRYLLRPSTLFDRTRYPLRSEVQAGNPAYDVSIARKGSHLAVSFNTCHDGAGRVDLEIRGLRKYIPELDTLSLIGRVGLPEDAFHAWGAVEDALIERSRFFTLIDIYGHYANRGDTIRVEGEWRVDWPPSHLRALNFLSSSANCGEFIDEASFRKNMQLGRKDAAAIVEAMRGIRFDLRSHVTHPIVGKGRFICTYPFPLLSPRALVESRARLHSLDGASEVRGHGGELLEIESR